MHESDNVAIVANDGGLPAGTELTAGLVLREFVPQGHKLALLEIGEDSPIIRYGVCIGYALENLVAGSSVHEGVMRTPAAPIWSNTAGPKAFIARAVALKPTTP